MRECCAHGVLSHQVRFAVTEGEVMFLHELGSIIVHALECGQVLSDDACVVTVASGEYTGVCVKRVASIFYVTVACVEFVEYETEE